jgi:hypothetical protein
MALEGTAESAAEIGSQVKDQVGELGRAAADTADSPRAAAADKIQSAAKSIHAGADALPGVGERAAGVAHGAAAKLETAADYIREHDLRSMGRDVTALAKNNPVPALLTAAALGFLLAKAFSSRN